MLTSSSEEATAIYEKFLNIDRHIQFKIEHPDDIKSLPLLNFKMQITPISKIYTSFYRKPTTKNLFVHFKSALPLRAKTNYIKMKFKEFTKEKDKITRTAPFINTLRTMIVQT